MHDKVFAHNFHLLHGNVFVLCSTFLNSAVLFYPFSYNMSVLMLYQFIFYYSSVNKLYTSGTMTYRRFLCIGRYFCSLLIFNLKGILLYDWKKGAHRTRRLAASKLSSGAETGSSYSIFYYTQIILPSRFLMVRSSVIELPPLFSGNDRTED